MAESRSADVAKAINRIMHLHPSDQALLLDTIEEYFTLPVMSSSESESDSELEDDLVAEPEFNGKKKMHITIHNSTHCI